MEVAMSTANMTNAYTTEAPFANMSWKLDSQRKQLATKNTTGAAFHHSTVVESTPKAATCFRTH